MQSRLISSRTGRAGCGWQVEKSYLREMPNFTLSGTVVPFGNSLPQHPEKAGFGAGTSRHGTPGKEKIALTD